MVELIHGKERKFAGKEPGYGDDFPGGIRGISGSEKENL